MRFSRRQWIGSLGLAGGGVRLDGATVLTGVEDAAVSAECLSGASTLLGSELSNERLKKIAPILKNREARLKKLRGFVVDDTVAPTQGVESDRLGNR